jgi:hypothetical protein
MVGATLGVWSMTAIAELKLSALSLTLLVRKAG